MTPGGVMRTLSPLRLLRPRNNAALTAYTRVELPPNGSAARCDPTACLRNCRCFAAVKDDEKISRDVWFTSNVSRYSPTGHHSEHQPPDQRTLQLGSTIRTLHDRLPTLLLSPLPSEILSPHISLHLFPSTHPHLPTVSGRIAYVAALWTAPVAWGRVPLIGNVKLTIMSERMVRNGGSAVSFQNRDEKLIVKWKTCGKTKHRDGTGGIYRGIGIGSKDPVDKIKDFIAGATEGSDAPAARPDNEEFCGIFVFEFDEEGRIMKHVIEHTDEGGHYDKMTRVVSVTDWLLGHFNGKAKEQTPEFAFCEERPHEKDVHIVDRPRRFH